MGIVQIPTQLPAQVGINPATKKMVTTDSLATITTAGYLNAIDLQSNPVSTNDVLEVLYLYNINTNSGTYGIFTVTIANGIITLVQWANPGDVLLPVVSGDFANFNGTTGQIFDAGFSPTDATKTKVVMLNATPTLNRPAVFTNANGTIGNLTVANGTEAANAVTASGQSGVITTSALTTAGGASYAITWTNTFIAAGSSVQVTLMGGTNTTKNITLEATAGTGTSTLTIYNNTAATSLNGTVFIGYSVI